MAQHSVQLPSIQHLLALAPPAINNIASQPAPAANNNTTRPSSTPSSPFPFQNFPPELRNAVYSNALAFPKSLALHNLCVPGLFHTSPQTRHECLPIFFADNDFDIYIGSAFFRKKRGNGPSARRRSPQGNNIDALLPGGLLLPPWVEDLEGEGEGVVLRSVTFHLYDPLDLPRVWSGAAVVDRERLLVAKLELRVVMRERSVEVFHTEDYGPLWRDEFTDRDATELFNDAVVLADQMANRQGFIGFTVEDLRRLAAAFGEDDGGNVAELE